jgi:hypothetical protein
MFTHLDPLAIAILIHPFYSLKVKIKIEKKKVERKLDRSWILQIRIASFPRNEKINMPSSPSVTCAEF